MRQHYSNSVISVIIDEVIHSERDRKILKRKLIDGVHFEPLAEEFGLSVRRTKDIVLKGTDIVFKYYHEYK